MSQRSQRVSPVDLDVLDAYLMSAGSPENSMGLSDLDGFLTGVATGPELIVPSAWLPLIWGGGEPEFATPEERNVILGTIMARFDEIVMRLGAGPQAFDPVFLEGAEGQIVVSDWAAGFMDAVILRAKAWAPILEQKEGRALMLPLLVLGSDDDRPMFDAAPLPADEVELLLEHGADVLMDAVPAIYEFWLERRT